MKELFSRQRQFHEQAKVQQSPEPSHKLGLQLQQPSHLCRKHPNLPTLNSCDLQDPSSCKNAGLKQQHQEVRPAMPGQQGPTLGLLSIQDKVVNQPLLQNPSCPWIGRPQNISLPRDQRMFTGVGLTSCSCPPEMLAGCLQFYEENWRRMSSNPWLLGIVSGYKIEFHSPPSQTYKLVTSCTQILIKQKITSLQSKGTIVPVITNPSEGFFSTLLQLESIY